MCHQISLICSTLFRLFKNWLFVRGLILGAMWFFIGTSAYELVQRLDPNAGKEVLNWLHELADPLPVILLFVAGTALVGLFSFVFRKLAPTRTADWTDGVADEISDAATNFACVSVVFVVWAWQTGPAPTYFDGTLILLMFIAALFFCKEEELDRVKGTDFGFEITKPSHDGVQVDAHTEFIGTAKRAIPDGFEAWLVRRFVGYEAEFYPMTRIHPVPNPAGPGYVWLNKKVFVGGRKGEGDGRRFEIWIVGRETSVLFRHYIAWNDYLHDDVKKQISATVEGQPLEKDIKDQISTAINGSLLSRPVKEHVEDGACVATRTVTRK